MALTDFLTEIANAIRIKSGTTELIPAQEFSQMILNIPTVEECEITLINEINTIVVPTSKKIDEINYIIIEAESPVNTGNSTSYIAEAFLRPKKSHTNNKDDLCSYGAGSVCYWSTNVSTYRIGINVGSLISSVNDEITITLDGTKMFKNNVPYKILII